MPNLSFAGLSDIGLSRPNNEDVWIAIPECKFFALADGMGGRKAGEVAANETIEELKQVIKSCSEMSIDSLRDAIERANRRVYTKSHSYPACRGMGTTLCCMYWSKHTLFYAHVGDSRIYRYRDGKLSRLTTDHSQMTRWIASGSPPEEKPSKNILTKAVGTSRKAEPDIVSTNYLPGDLFLLCSDGLSDVLAESDMEKIIERSETLDLMASRLIEKAKIKGSHDNITVLLVKYDGKDLFRQQLDDQPRQQGSQSDDGGTIGATSESF